MKTTHDPMGGDTPWVTFWGVLFEFLFVPSFAVAVEAGPAGMVGRMEKSCTERKFRDQARDMLQPGTSALLLVVPTGAPDAAAEAISRHRGTVLQSPILEVLESVPGQGPDF